MPEPVPLFAYEKRKRPTPPPVDPAVKVALKRLMLSVYMPIYRQTFGEAPNVGGREWSILKRLIVKHGPELVEARLRLYLTWTDPWVRAHGHTMPIFERNWDALRAWADQKNGVNGTGVQCGHTPRCPSAAKHSQRVVADLRGSPL